MWNSVLIQRTLPLTISYLLLIIAAISFDCLLHIAHLAWIGCVLWFNHHHRLFVPLVHLHPFLPCFHRDGISCSFDNWIFPP